MNNLELSNIILKLSAAVSAAHHLPEDIEDGTAAAKERALAAAYMLEDTLSGIKNDLGNSRSFKLNAIS